MKSLGIALVAGALFGAGLLVSGMTDPRNVVGFLDFFGHWNPNLGAVMAGAIGVHAVALRVLARRDDAPESSALSIAPRRGVDGKLLLGAAVFGVGWGLGGYCPGPAIVSLASGGLPSVLFVAALVAGVLLADMWTRPTPKTRVEARQEERVDEAFGIG
jgi:uncharacterized protein